LRRPFDIAPVGKISRAGGRVAHDDIALGVQERGPLDQREGLGQGLEQGSGGGHALGGGVQKNIRKARVLGLELQRPFDIFHRQRETIGKAAGNML